MPKYTHLGGLFWKSQTKVFSEGHPLLLDPKLTRVFFDAWACDGKRVYHHCLERRSIDASSFVALNGAYAKDSKCCYCDVVGVAKSIPKADPETFVVLDSGEDKQMFGLGTNHPSGYAKDADHVFFNGNIIKNANSQAFTSLRGCYGTDGSSMFFEQYRLNGAVPIRWRYLGGYYSRDDKYVFYEHRRVKNARVEHFRQVEPFDYEIAHDGNIFYSRGKPYPVDEYVSFLRQYADSSQSFAKIVEDGSWQKNIYSRERPYREPDETRIELEDIRLGWGRKKVDAKFGIGRDMPQAEWNDYFEDLEPEPGREVVTWTRGCHKLVCVLDNDHVIYISVDSAE